MRGLDYYTRTVFEFTSDRLGAQSGVGGGGRYDGLVEQLGGPATPGIGWAAGIERILLAGAPPHPAPAPVDLFVAYEPPRDGRESAHRHAPAGAFALLAQARAAGLTAQMELAGRSLKGQLGFASALDARYVAIVAAGETVLKTCSAPPRRRWRPTRWCTPSCVACARCNSSAAACAPSGSLGRRSRRGSSRPGPARGS